MSTTSAAPPRAPSPRLTPIEKRALAHAAAGWTNPEIARQLRLPPGKITQFLSGLAQIYGTGESRPALIRAVLADRLIDLPEPGRLAPEFTDPELTLVRAIARHRGPNDVAAAARLTSLTDLVTRTDHVVRKAGARNATHLVALFDVWDLLNTEHDERNPR